jgi:GT2 family glycosyltransferase/glycosyltransferase involved in cell wall biosynthesis
MTSAQVIIPVFGKFQMALDVVKRAVKHTPQEIRINVIDDGSPNVSEFEKMLIQERLMDQINFISQSKNLGFVKTMNRAFRATRPDDVIILNSDCFVSDGWFERIIQTAKSSDLVSTVTALTNEGSIATVKVGDERLGEIDLQDLDRINREIIKHVVDYKVQVPVGVGHCMWISRTSLETVGYFDEIFSPGYGEEVDFCIRAVQKGFHHLICKETFVHHIGGQSFDKRKTDFQLEHESILRTRYPNFHNAVLGLIHRSSEIEAASMNVMLAVRPLRLLLDCRLADSSTTGTSRYIVELAKAVSSNSDCETHLLVKKSMIETFLGDFEPEEIIGDDEILQFIASKEKFDVVFRIGQMGTLEILKGLWDIARRVGLVQLDFIAADNYGYFENEIHYLEYLDLTKYAISMCDLTLFLTETVMNEARRFRSHNSSDIYEVIGCGLNHMKLQEAHERNSEYVVVLGSSYAHKNREWSIRLFAEVMKTAKPNLKLLLIGVTPAKGETTFSDKRLVNQLGISENVEFMDWTSDIELESIFKRCVLSISTAVSEGFGLIPLEMAMNGVVPVSYKGTSYIEHSGGLPYSLSLSNLEEDAKTIQKLLNDATARSEQLSHALEMAAKHKWENAAETLIKGAFFAARRPCQMYPEMRREFFRKSEETMQRRKLILLRLRNTKVMLRAFPNGRSRTAKLLKFARKITSIR